MNQRSYWLSSVSIQPISNLPPFLVFPTCQVYTVPKTGVDLEVFPSKVAAPAVKCMERVETLRVLRHLAVDHSLTQLFMSCERTSFRCPESVAVWPVWPYTCGMFGTQKGKHCRRVILLSWCKWRTARCCIWAEGSIGLLNCYSRYFSRMAGMVLTTYGLQQLPGSSRKLWT